MKSDPVGLFELYKRDKSLFDTRTTLNSQAEYDFTKQPKKSEKLMQNFKSSIPMLSDHYRKSKTHSGAYVPSAEEFHKTFSQFRARKGNNLSNIFMQSDFQR